MIPARYAGMCAECGEPWRVGDLIRFRPSTGWRHAVCPDPLPDIQPGETACSTCWLIHPEGACDR